MTDKKNISFFAIIIPVILIIAAGAFYFLNKEAPVQPKVVLIATEPKVIDQQPEIEPPTKNIPVTDVKESKPIASETIAEPTMPPEADKPMTVKEVLPSLYESDELVLNSAIALSSAKESPKLLEKVDILHSFVVFTDHIAQGEVISNFSPVIKPEAPFTVYDDHGAIYLDTKSYQRYDAYANIIDQLDVDAVVAQYKRFLPLIDADYQEMGNENGTFTDALVLAIDNINETPIISTEIELVAPSAMYQFSDTHLENLNNAQKLMIRMGPENIKKIQRKLAELKKKLN